MPIIEPCFHEFIWWRITEKVSLFSIHFVNLLSNNPFQKTQHRWSQRGDFSPLYCSFMCRLLLRKKKFKGKKMYSAWCSWCLLVFMHKKIKIIINSEQVTFRLIPIIFWNILSSSYCAIVFYFRAYRSPYTQVWEHPDSWFMKKFQGKFQWKQ